MTWPDNRRRPWAGASSKITAGERITAQSTANHPLPLEWRRRLDRRRACHELNALLGRPSRPDIDALYPRPSMREAA